MLSFKVLNQLQYKQLQLESEKKKPTSKINQYLENRLVIITSKTNGNLLTYNLTDRF